MPDPDSAEALLSAMRAAHRADPFPDLRQRRDRLDRLEEALVTHEDRLIAAMQADFSHRAAEECRLFDITLPLGSIRKARRSLRRQMRRRRVMTPLVLQPARLSRQPVPKGVVGVIAPWNFPVYLALGPLAAALAAGNRVMLKPSEITPRTSDVMAEMLHGAFAREECRVLTGGPDLGAGFANLPFDHLFFTGSTAVGRKVAEAAGRNLVPVTLELGGKSPVIIAPDADLEHAARRVAFGKLASGGQACVSPDYALVPEALRDGFVAALAGAMQAVLPGGTASEAYTAIVSDRHRTRLRGLLEDAEARGARILYPLGQEAPAGRIAPALVLDPPADAAIMGEEIFGPLFPVLTYASRTDAYRFVAERDHPLVLYLFTRSREERAFWRRQSLSGGMSVNETMLHFACETLPVGGVGASGIGAYHGDAGFETFSHMKSVFHQPRLNLAGLVTPPVTPVKRIARRVLRRLL